MTSSQRNSQGYRRQMRGFIAVWIAVTLLIGVATFVGIYVGTGHLEAADASNTNQNQQAIVPNSIPINTNTINDSSLIISNPANSAVLDESDESAVAATEPSVADEALTDGQEVLDTNNTEALPEADTLDTSAQLDTEVFSALPESSDDTSGLVPAQQETTLTPTPQPTIPPKQNPNFDLGVHVLQNFNNDPDITAGYMDAAANQLNLNWIKVQVRWEFVEPQQGVYDWTIFDVLFAEASKKNLKVLASVVTSPMWARELGATEGTHGPPADNQTFANFIATMIGRYPGQIHAIEVWNEMNLAREWSSPRGLIAADYVTLVTTVANTVRFLDPNIIIVSGALSPTGVNDGVIAIDDFFYTDQLIAAGLLNVVDCFGAHHNGINVPPDVPFDQLANDPTAVYRGPYDNKHHSWSFYSTLTTYANKIQAAGYNVPLCVTEFGWPVAEDFDPATRPVAHFEFSEDNTLEEQRIYIVKAIELMQEWDFVWLAFIWNLNFAPEMGGNLAVNDSHNMLYSLIRPNYTPAPVWAYISDMNFRGRLQR